MNMIPLTTIIVVVLLGCLISSSLGSFVTFQQQHHHHYHQQPKPCTISRTEIQQKHVHDCKRRTSCIVPIKNRCNVSTRRRNNIHSSTQLQSRTQDDYISTTSSNQDIPDVIDDENVVQVGSKDYYSGFISRGINEEPEERITGDAVLVPTLKFVGGFAAILVVLFVGFLVSNGLL